MLAPVDDTSQLVRIFAERRSIELADMVIGGSGHLLTWMEHNGYRMPQGRTFMQPNVAVPAEIDPMLLRNRPQAGTRVPINEIVFFGRLEGRKGLDIFCDAIRDLINEGASVPKITFLGKFGTPIATHPELTVREYIESEASSWGVEWQIIDTYAQAQALTYLLGSGRLAVMPSLIENSSLTIYETTNFRIPFVASDRGGNPELVKEEHRDAVLTEPHPVLLAEKLSEVLKLGGLVAESSFDNASNLAQWCEFHSNLATVIDEIKERRTTPGQTIPSNQITRNLMDHLLAAGVPRMKVTVSACLVLRDNHALIETSLQSLVEQAAVLEEIILINDGSKSDAAVDWILSQREFFKTHGWKIIDRRHYGAADSRNLAAEHAKGSHILFLEPGTALKPNALATLIRAAACSEAHVLLSFYEELPARTTPKSSGRRIISLPGDPCYPFFDSDAGWAPLILVSQDTFKTLGGFTVDYNVAGDVEEFLMHASTTGLTVEVVPEDLAVFQLSPVKRGRLNREGASFRSIRPHLNAVPTNLQPLLIASRSLNIRVEMDQRSILRMAARRWLPNTLQNQLARILRLRLFRPFRRPKA